MRSVLSPEDRRVMPPELLVDKNNPANDTYYQSLRGLRSLAVAQATRMRPMHVQVVRLHQQGVRSVEISKKLQVTQATVSRTLKRFDSRELLQILQHLAHLTEGPNLEVRRNMLWRIAHQNESMEPNTAISALKELNKLDGAYPEQTQQLNQNLTITINQNLFPKTDLDAPP